MKLARWVALGGLLALNSCDVAVMMLLSKDEGGGHDDPQVLATAAGPEFQVAVAFLPDEAAADAARNELIAANGIPAGPLWTEIGSGDSTTEFDPTTPPASINTVLIRAKAGYDYRLDSVEILDDLDRVVEHASGTVWSNQTQSPGDLLGPPDGSGAVTTAAAGADAFLFTRFAGPIERVRINAQPESGGPVSGDVVAVRELWTGYDERPGGLAIAPDGLIYLTLSVADSIYLVRYAMDSSLVDYVEIESGIQTTVGSHSVAHGPGGTVFTASTVSDGRVLVRSHDPNLNLGWSRTFYSGRRLDRVESNGIAVDGSGNVVVAGAMNSSSHGLNHWLAKVAGGNGAVIFDNRAGGEVASTYWRAVTTGPGNLIHTAGDRTSSVTGFIQFLTSRFGAAGALEWEDVFGDSYVPSDVGNALSLDGAGNLLVGGSMGTTPEGRNGFLVRYSSAGALSAIVTFNGPANGDDEILDIAVDSDGSIYAVGYETDSTQGENIWVRKYDATFTPVWTRTHHGGIGDDRAVSVAIHGDRIVVSGFETVGQDLTNSILRVYAK